MGELDISQCLPCPFCGRKPDLKWEFDSDGEMIYWLICAYPRYPIETLQSITHKTIFDAIKMWNTRMPVIPATGTKLEQAGTTQ